jgi:hypothetical protein
MRNNAQGDRKTVSCLNWVKLLKLKVISNNAHIKETRKDKDKGNEEEIKQTKN